MQALESTQEPPTEEEIIAEMKRFATFWVECAAPGTSVKALRARVRCNEAILRQIAVRNLTKKPC